jgi:hypothetical protein
MKEESKTPAKERRDIGGILPLARNPIVNRRLAQGGDNHETEEVKEKDPGTREPSARRLRETGQITRQTAAGGDGKSVESSEKIGRSRYCGSRKEFSGANNRREETEQCQESQEKEAESFTGAPCTTRRSDESQVGCEESR